MGRRSRGHIFDGDLYHLWYIGGVTWAGLQIGYATALPYGFFLLLVLRRSP